MNKLHNELANCIRFLSIDAVQKANSGHPGLPMGMVIPIGMPGCPEFAFCTASIDKNLIAFDKSFNFGSTYKIPI